MAYNNYFPTNYQPVYQYPQYTPVQQTQQQVQQQYQPAQSNTGLTWVQGEAAAKSFPVAPGSSVLLMDSEASVFYIRSTDTSGMPLPLRIFDYTERVQQQNAHSPVSMQQEPKFDLGNYVTREEFESRLSQLSQANTEPIVTKAPARKEKANA